MQLSENQGRTFHKEEPNNANEKEGHKEEGSEEEITAALGKLICGLRAYEGLFHFGNGQNRCCRRCGQRWPNAQLRECPDTQVLAGRSRKHSDC